MPKTARNLWSQIVTFENLLSAFKCASKSRRFRSDVLAFRGHLEENLLDIQKALNDGTWEPGPIYAFTICDPKVRTIEAPPFCDRVVHHAIVSQIEPAFERRFIPQSFACRSQKGTHAASACLMKMLQETTNKWGCVYVLKADIASYFPSINHDVLLSVISKTIGDKRLLATLEKIVTANGHEKGIPLGSLTSQLFANAYLDILDHYIKDELGIRYYIRYMDDFIILHHSKKELWQTLATIRDFLSANLKLTLNRKTKVFPLSQGVDFVGYRHWTGFRLPRKRNLRSAKKRFAFLSKAYSRGEVDLDTVRCTVASFIGYMKHCSGSRSCESTLSRLVLIPPTSNEE